MKDLYLVDGYNVIFWLPKVFDREDLESSRKKLIDLLEDYGAHNNLEMIVVFDGQGSSNKARIEKMGKNFTIVFTPSRMTADSYIEKSPMIAGRSTARSTLSLRMDRNRARSLGMGHIVWLSMISSVQ